MTESTNQKRDLEREMTRLLHDAAAALPQHRLRGPAAMDTPGSRRRRPPGGAVAAAALLAAAAIVIGVTQLSGSDNGVSGGQEAAATCDGAVQLNGRSYYPTAVLNIPQRGRPLGTATTLKCDDGNGPSKPDMPNLFAIDGIDATSAVVTDAGVVMVANGVVDDRLDALSRPYACEPGSQTFQIDAVILGVDGAQNGQLQAPYTATVKLTGRDLTQATTYQSAETKIRVTDRTDNGTDYALISQAVDTGTPIRITATCEDGKLAATQIRD